MTIKVTVQNGAHHGFSRAEASAMVKYFPAAWEKIATDVVLYQSNDARLHCQYFEKSRLLGVFWPGEQYAQPDKSEAIDEMLVAFAAISQHGTWPLSLSRAKRADYLLELAPLREKCIGAVSNSCD